MKVLITNNSFRDFRGSELVVAELAEEFLNRGAEVWIYSNLAMPPMTEAIENSKRLFIVNDPYAKFDTDFDIIWIQQNVIPDVVIHKLSSGGMTNVVVWNHLSSLIHMEFPILADIEKQLADYIYSISELVADKVSTFGIDRAKINFFRNLAPREFTNIKYKNKSRKLESVLVVSNHPPVEILGAREVLAKMGLKWSSSESLVR